MLRPVLPGSSVTWSCQSKCLLGFKKPSLRNVCFQNVVPYHLGGEKKKLLLWLLSKYLVALLKSCLFRAELFEFVAAKILRNFDPSIPGLLISQTFRGSDLELTFPFHYKLFTPVTHPITRIRENSNTTCIYSYSLSNCCCSYAMLQLELAMKCTWSNVRVRINKLWVFGSSVADSRPSAGLQGLRWREASSIFLLFWILPPWVSSNLRKKNAV